MATKFYEFLGYTIAVCLVIIVAVLPLWGALACVKGLLHTLGF